MPMQKSIQKGATIKMAVEYSTGYDTSVLLSYVIPWPKQFKKIA
jgi:hypothetical protein